MTLERRNAVFEKIKDSDLIGKLISQNGLKKDVAGNPNGPRRYRSVLRHRLGSDAHPRPR